MWVRFLFIIYDNDLQAMRIYGENVVVVDGDLDLVHAGDTRTLDKKFNNQSFHMS